MRNRGVEIHMLVPADEEEANMEVWDEAERMHELDRSVEDVVPYHVDITWYSRYSADNHMLFMVELYSSILDRFAV